MNKDDPNKLVFDKLTPKVIEQPKPISMTLKSHPGKGLNVEEHHKHGDKKGEFKCFQLTDSKKALNIWMDEDGTIHKYDEPSMVCKLYD